MNLDIETWLQWEFLPYIIASIGFLGTVKLVKLIVLNKGDK